MARRKKSDEDPDSEVSTDTEETEPVDESMLLLTAEQCIQMWSTAGGDEEQFRSMFQLIVDIGEQQQKTAPSLGGNPRPMPVIA